MIGRSMQSPPRAQHGVALVVALVILLVLTVVGVTALITTAFEGRMAGSTQELNRAFQAAESGVDRTIANGSQFNLTATQTATYAGVGSTAGSASTSTTFRELTKPPRGSGYSASRFKAAHFQINSTGSAGGGAQVTVVQGTFQITPAD
jgi:type IV pilus assembly protein PilX